MGCVSIVDEYACTQAERVVLRADGQDGSCAQLAQSSRRAAAAPQEPGVGAGDRLVVSTSRT